MELTKEQKFDLWLLDKYPNSNEEYLKEYSLRFTEKKINSILSTDYTETHYFCGTKIKHYHDTTLETSGLYVCEGQQFLDMASAKEYALELFMNGTFEKKHKQKSRYNNIYIIGRVDYNSQVQGNDISFYSHFSIGCNGGMVYTSNIFETRFYSNKEEVLEELSNGFERKIVISHNIDQLQRLIKDKKLDVLQSFGNMNRF